MEIQQVNREDAEKINVVVKNVDGGGSITKGLGVALTAAGASIDGLSAVQNVATNAKGFIGVAIDDIPINGFGRVTALGYVASILVSNEGSSVTVTRGDFLIPSAVAGQFTSGVTDQAASTLLYKYAYAAETLTHSAATYIQGVVRAI